jgi:hypothetical protein
MKVTCKTVVPAVVLAAVMTLATIPCAPVADAQQLTVQTERRDHPNIVKAIEAMNAGLRDLEVAPSDFGGNKGAAMHDIRQAIHSLKKALYFRLKMDDTAIDRAP